MIISAHPLAEDELVDAAVYYAERANPELGEDFIAEFERCIGLLHQHPMLGAIWRSKFRRLPMRRFPYSVIYCISGEVLRVIAMAHQRRKPGYWRGRN